MHGLVGVKWYNASMMTENVVNFYPAKPFILLTSLPVIVGCRRTKYFCLSEFKRAQWKNPSAGFSRQASSHLNGFGSGCHESILFIDHEMRNSMSCLPFSLISRLYWQYSSSSDFQGTLQMLRCPP